MQAARLAAEQVEAAVKAAEEGFKEGNTLEATAKAAVAAWRSSQVQHPFHMHVVVVYRRAGSTQSFLSGLSIGSCTLWLTQPALPERL